MQFGDGAERLALGVLLLLRGALCGLLLLDWITALRYFGERDPTTRVMLERILAQEEEHANDMHDLLVSNEGRPMLL